MLHQIGTQRPCMILPALPGKTALKKLKKHALTPPAAVCWYETFPLLFYMAPGTLLHIYYTYRYLLS